MKSEMNRSPGSIAVEDIELDYPIYHNLVADRARYLLGKVVPLWRPKLHRVLDGISFRIAAGELVGIVGRNGAGKTTLLKVISGLVAPNRGRVAVAGRIMALLSMGVGLRPTLTGRENIEFGGLLFGMTPAEVAEIMDDIAAFSELGEYLDQPYFVYSSGMRARLAFSLAVHVKADIFIMDETLAVGDQKFVGKCYRRLRDIQNSGRTILFVSHNLGEIARLAPRTIVIEQGRVIFDGDTFEAVERYDRLLAQIAERERQEPSAFADVSVKFDLRDGRGQAADLVYIGEPIELGLVVESTRDLGLCYPFLRIVNAGDGALTCYVSHDRWSNMAGVRAKTNPNIEIPAGRTRLTWSIPHWVAGEGSYVVDAYIGPQVTADTLEISGGRTWRSIGRVGATYRNPQFKGAITVLEMPVASAGAGAGADNREV